MRLGWSGKAAIAASLPAVVGLAAFLLVTVDRLREVTREGFERSLLHEVVSAARAVARGPWAEGEMQAETPSMTPEERTRRQRVLERRIAQRLEGVDLDAWYAKLDRGWQSPEQLTALLVAVKPVNPPRADSDPARFVRDLVFDPAFQLK